MTYPSRRRDECLIIVGLGNDLATGFLALFGISSQHAVESDLHVLQIGRHHVVGPVVAVDCIVKLLPLRVGNHLVGVVLLTVVLCTLLPASISQAALGHAASLP